MPNPIDEMCFQLENLANDCNQFYRGQRWAAHKSISVTIRTLLVGSSGDAPLATQVIGDVHLRPLARPPAPDKPDYITLPAHVHIGGVCVSAGANVQNLHLDGSAVANIVLDEMFDGSRPPIPLAQWLSQPFLRPIWTLEKFIKAVAHGAGGAHVTTRNKELREIIAALEAWGSCHWHIMPGIGRSVHPQLIEQRVAAHPDHQTYVP